MDTNSNSRIFRAELEASPTHANPEIVYYPPESKLCTPNGVGLVIFPGGAYHGLAEHEGETYARFFSTYGFASFVVKYRLGSQGYRHPAMLEDALAAVETLRKRKEEFGIYKDWIGLIGSSAGGHLAAHTITSYHKYKSSVNLRPDFAVLCYPVITTYGQFAHEGSIRNLVGENASDALLNEVSPEKNVSHNTPPCFLWHTAEDGGVAVENSIIFASALRKYNIPFELHIYEKGRHGLGLASDFDWGKEVIRWLRYRL